MKIQLLLSNINMKNALMVANLKGNIHGKHIIIHYKLLKKMLQK